MSGQDFKKLERGDHVTTIHNEVGAIQYFGYFNGSKWLRSSRKRANGAWLWFRQSDSGGYVHRSDMLDYAQAPTLQIKDLKWKG